MERANEYGFISHLKKDGSVHSRLVMSKTSLVFGRDEECDIRILSKTVSSKHCILNYAVNQKVFLAPMNITNHIFVNTEKIMGPVQLKHGDTFTIMGRKFKFEYPSSPKDSDDPDTDSENIVIIGEHLKKVGDGSKNQAKIVSSYPDQHESKATDGSSSKTPGKRNSWVTKTIKVKDSSRDETSSNNSSTPLKFAKSLKNYSKHQNVEVISVASSSSNSPTIIPGENISNKKRQVTFPSCKIVPVMKLQDLPSTSKKKDRIPFLESSSSSDCISGSSSPSPRRSPRYQRGPTSPANWRHEKVKASTSWAPIHNSPRGKKVSFGPNLSPEQFDRTFPPDSPLRKGSIPANSMLSSAPYLEEDVKGNIVEDDTLSLHWPDDTSCINTSDEGSEKLSVTSSSSSKSTIKIRSPKYSPSKRKSSPILQVKMFHYQQSPSNRPSVGMKSEPVAHSSSTANIKYVRTASAGVDLRKAGRMTSPSVISISENAEIMSNSGHRLSSSAKSSKKPDYFTFTVTPELRAILQENARKSLGTQTSSVNVKPLLPTQQTECTAASTESRIENVTPLARSVKTYSRLERTQSGSGSLTPSPSHSLDFVKHTVIPATPPDTVLNTSNINTDNVNSILPHNTHLEKDLETYDHVNDSSLQQHTSPNIVFSGKTAINLRRRGKRPPEKDTHISLTSSSCEVAESSISKRARVAEKSTGERDSGPKDTTTRSRRNAKSKVVVVPLIEKRTRGKARIHANEDGEPEKSLEIALVTKAKVNKSDKKSEKLSEQTKTRKQNFDESKAFAKEKPVTKATENMTTVSDNIIGKTLAKRGKTKKNKVSPKAHRTRSKYAVQAESKRKTASARARTTQTKEAVEQPILICSETEHHTNIAKCGMISEKKNPVKKMNSPRVTRSMKKK